MNGGKLLKPLLHVLGDIARFLGQQIQHNEDVTLFEAGDYVSFMSCGMELYLEDKVTDVSQDYQRYHATSCFSPGYMTKPSCYNCS